MRSLKQALEEFDHRLTAKLAEKQTVQQQLEKLQQRMLEIQVKIESIGADRERIMEMSGRYGMLDEKNDGNLVPPQIQRPLKEVQSPLFSPQRPEAIDSGLFKNSTPALRQVGGSPSGATDSNPVPAEPKDDETEVADVMPASRRLRQATAAARAKDEKVVSNSGSPVSGAAPLGTPPFQINNQAGLPVPVDEPLPAALNTRKLTSGMEVKPPAAETQSEGRKRPGRGAEPPANAPVSRGKQAAPPPPANVPGPAGNAPSTGDTPSEAASSQEEAGVPQNLLKEKPAKEVSNKENSARENLPKEAPAKEETDTVKKVNDALRSLFR